MKRIAYIVAPDGASGGGMGRVKDYIIDSPKDLWGDLLPIPLITRDGGGRLRSAGLLFRTIRMIRRAKGDGSLALVHVNMGDRLSLWRKGAVVWQCHALGVPAFIHLHAVELDTLPSWMLRPLAAVFRRATAVIVLGEVYRRWVTDTLGVTTIPIEVLRNGVPIEPVAARVHGVGLSDPLHILFLGSLGERKGVSDLIAALARLPRRARGWRATIAGPGDIAHYQALAHAAGIGGEVAFPGWCTQEQVRVLLADADMLVLPSYHEGLPLVILEALALGTPVVATPVGAIPEVLEDQSNILFTNPGDQSGLARQIGYLIDDFVLRQRLCDKGLETFRQSFTIDAFARGLLAIWKRHTRAGGADAG